VEPLQLHAAQVGWHQAWAANFQEFLRRKNPDAVVEGAWPRGEFPTRG
jgi:DNA polymerase-3 subunit epsilon